MRHSDSIATISAALAKALPEIQNATKDSKNPHFRSDYASLKSVLETAKPVLASHGIVVLQGPGWDGGVCTLTTRLLHESGEWIESVAGSPVSKADPQGVGSAITYLRRYSLAAMAGITQEDDDGNAASQTRNPETGQRHASAPKASTEETACPKCGGGMWDNRATKKGKQPDYKCQDKECDTAIWLDSITDTLRQQAETAAISATIDTAEAQRVIEAIHSGDLGRILRAQDWLGSRLDGSASA